MKRILFLEGLVSTLDVALFSNIAARRRTHDSVADWICKKVHSDNAFV